MIGIMNSLHQLCLSKIAPMEFGKNAGHFSTVFVKMPKLFFRMDDNANNSKGNIKPRKCFVFI